MALLDDDTFVWPQSMHTWLVRPEVFDEPENLDDTTPCACLARARTHTHTHTHNAHDLTHEVRSLEREATVILPGSKCEWNHRWRLCPDDFFNIACPAMLTFLSMELVRRLEPMLRNNFLKE